MPSNQVGCKHPGCSRPAFNGSSYCSKSHQDASANLSPLSAQSGGASTMSPLSPSKSTTSEGEIKFYDRTERYYEFTNFALYPVFYDGNLYPTSEHLFQALKFEDKSMAERIRKQSTSREAFEEARKLKNYIRKGWYDEKVNIKMMEKVLLLKFTQHSKLRNMLLDTGEAKLIEDSPHDPFWGVGADGLGQNQLGIGLMKIRRVLQTLG